MSSKADSEPLRISLSNIQPPPQPTRASSFSSTNLSPVDSFDPFSPPPLSTSPNRSSDSALLLSHSHTPPPRTPSPSPPPVAAAGGAVDWSDLSVFGDVGAGGASVARAQSQSGAMPSLPALPPAIPKSLPLPLHNRSSSQSSSPAAKPSPAPTHAPAVSQLKPSTATTTFAPPPPPPQAATSSAGLQSSSAAASSVSLPSSKTVPPPPQSILLNRLPSFSSSSSASTSAPPPTTTTPTFTTHSPSPAPLTFADTLHHKPALIITEITTTLATVRSLAAYYQKLAAAYRDTASAVHRLSAAEYGRVSGGAGGSSVVSGVMGLFDRMNGVGQLYGVLESDVRERCVEPLKRCYDNGSNMVKESESECKKALTAVEQATTAMLKDKEVARQALAALTREKERADDSTAANHSSDAAAGGGTASSLLAQANTNAAQLSSHLFSAFKQVQRHLTTATTTTTSSDPSPTPSAPRNPAVDAARKKAIRCCESYQRSVDAVNAARQRCNKEVLPRVLKDMQAQQEMTLSTLAATVATFVELTERFAARLAASAGEVRVMLEAVDVDTDVQHFIMTSIDQHGQATAAEVAKYELPITAKDLTREDTDAPHALSKHDSGSSSSNNSGLFKNTLDGCMRHDQSSQPLTTPPFSAIPPTIRLDVPLLVPYLILALIHLDGLNSEGIFRLSASADEVSAVRQRLDAHDYRALEGLDSAHTAAALLKSFLRDLAEPLIPAVLYDRCIELGRSHMLGDRPAAIRRSELTELMSTVPQLNRRVLFHLLALLAVIGRAEHSERSRMTPQNLSIVFAPSVLRAGHSDAVLLLAESKFACQFVWMLLEGWEEEREAMWKDEWTWSERPEAGCMGYPWFTGDRTAVAAAASGEQEERRVGADENGSGASSSSAAASLPAGWQSSVDSATGVTYYFHTQTKEVTWVKPAG